MVAVVGVWHTTEKARKNKIKNKVEEAVDVERCVGCNHLHAGKIQHHREIVCVVVAMIRVAR